MLLISLYILFLVLVFSLSVLIAYKFSYLRGWTHRLLAFAAGFLLSLSFLKIIPKGATLNPKTFGLGLILSYLLMIFMEHFLRISFLHGDHEKGESISEHSHKDKDYLITSGMVQCEEGELRCHLDISSEAHLWTFSAVMAFALHNFSDGIGFAMGFLKGVGLGPLTFLAITFHKIPAGMGLGTLLARGRVSLTNLIKYLLLITVFFLTGVVFTFLLGNALNPSLRAVFVGFAGGSFIYLGATHMLPEVHKENDKWCFLIFLLGVLTILPLEVLLKISH